MSTAFISHSTSTTRKSILLLVIVATIAVSFSSIFAIRAEAAADTCTWTGGTSNDMNDANNWTGCDGFGIPESGDSYVFPQSASNKALSIDSFSVNPASMSFTGTGYSLNRTGSQVLDFIGSGVAIEATQNVDVNVPIVIGDGTLQNSTLRAAEDTAINLNGTVTFNTGIGEINIGSVGYTGGVFFNGTISGSTSQFIAQNEGYVEITSTGNDYAATTVGAESNGNFRCASASCFGDEANDIYVGGGGIALLVEATYNNNIVTSAPTSNVSQINAFEDITLMGDVTVSSSMRFTQTGTGTKTLDFSVGATISIASGQNLAFFGANSTDSSINVPSSIEGTGDGIVMDDVTLVLNGVSTFEGGVSVGSDGILRAVGTNTSLGDSASTTTVNEGGMLEFDQLGVSATLPWDLSLAGEGPDGEGAMVLRSNSAITYNGDILLNGDTTIGNTGTSSALLSLFGKISGTGDLTFISDGDGGIISMSGTEVNDYVGETNVLGVRLNLSKTAGLSVPGNIYAASDSTQDALLVVGSNGGNQIADDAIVEIYQDPLTNLYFGSFNEDEVIGSLTGNGNFLVNGANQGVTIGGGNQSGTFSGLFTNSANTSVITKIGTGTWTLTDATYAGTAGQEPSIVIEDGNVVFGSDLSDFPVTVADGGTLKGTGSVGSTTIESGGTLSTGNSPGCLTLTDITLNSGSVFTQEIAGGTACADYDRTTISGNADLGGATLNVVLSATPSTGTVLTIINAVAVNGTFDGLSDGDIITVDGVRFQINYTPTSVTLTELANGDLATTGSNILNNLFLGFTLFLIGIAISRKARNFNLHV